MTQTINAPSSQAAPLDIPIIGFISNKGGVGKTSLATTTAVYLAKQDFRVRLADLDRGQDSATDWHKRRLERDLRPAISVQLYPSAIDAMQDAAAYDILILDGPAKASRMTLDIALAATLIIHPVQPSLMDLLPAVRTYNEMVRKGIPKERLRFLVSRADTKPEAEQARIFLEDAGYQVFKGVVDNKPAYRQASDAGKTMIEASYVQLRERAKRVMSEIVKEATANYV